MTGKTHRIRRMVKALALAGCVTAFAVPAAQAASPQVDDWFRDGLKAAPASTHGNLGIVDDSWLTVGSANLNEHSLFNDTEVNVVVRDPELVRTARLRLWSEHLEEDADGDPIRVVDERWRPRASAESQRHKLRLLHGVSRRSGALWGPVNGLLVDG